MDPSTAIQLLYWLLLFSFLSYFLYRLVQAYYLSDLNAIPNAHIFAPFSRLSWAFLVEYSGQITLKLPILHRKLGPLVRIGPNEVSFYSLEIYKEIHSIGNKFIKDPRVYGEFVQNSHPSLFSLTDPQEHLARRRLMGQLFNRSKIPLQQDLVIQQIDRLIEIIEDKNDYTVDLLAACRALEADIVTLFGFGESIGGLDAYSKSTHVDMVTENDNKSKWMPVHQNFPELVNIWHKIESILYATIGYQTLTTKAMEEYNQWTLLQLSTTLSNIHDESPKTSPDLVTTMIRSGLPARTALAEAKEQLGPGTDTTSATLAHILWGLAHDKQFQKELSDSLEAAGWPRDLTSLESVPKLKACVKEGIRWAGAASAMLPRIAPEGGVKLAGKFVPGGTVLTSSPIWYLHDEIAFPLPHSFRPRRWLKGEDEGLYTSLQDDYYVPFSKGPHSCIGMHFAYLELYIGVSRILEHFKLSLPPSLLQLNQLSTYASLPPRLEWVAAVPMIEMKICFELKRSS